MTLLHRKPALPLDARRSAVLLVLLASGLVLLAWTGLPKLAQMGENAAQATPMAPVTPPPGSLREILARPDFVPTHHHVLLGKQAPDLELGDSTGATWNLKELRGRSRRCDLLLRLPLQSLRHAAFRYGQGPALLPGNRRLM